MHLNHPKTIPTPPPPRQPQSVEKLSSETPVPRAKKVGDRCSRMYNTKNESPCKLWALGDKDVST